MAKQHSFITFTGKLGHLIGYCRNGKYFLRSMPEIVRQTAATRKAARRFGAASKKGALIRTALVTELDIRCDSGYINRLTRTLIPAAGNRKKLSEGFRFNQDTGIDQFFAVAPVFSANRILEIPGQTLPRMKGITTLEVKVIGSRIDLITHTVVDTQAVTILLDLREPFTGVAIPMDVPGTGTLIVTLQVRCIQDSCPSSDKRYQAADIIAVLDPETQPVIHQPAYVRRTMFRPQREAVSRAVYAYMPVPVILRE
jgi:hypothetical protein